MPRSPAASLDSETVDKIEMAAQIMMANDDVPGLAIGIVKDGEVVYAEGFGDANIESGIPVTSQSLFNMAQVSMMFTSAAIMQLVEQGLIDLDAPVTDYLSYFKLDDPRFTEITVRQLLDNTSGLPNTSVEKDASWKNRDYDNPDNEEGALERFVRSLDGLALIAEPGGGDMLYSSIGYDILGDIVAKVSGQSYETYMQENILDPLGMDHSTFMLDEADAELLTAGHRGDVASPEVEVWEFFPFNMQHSPSNGLITNVDDMNKWALALLNGGELDGVRILEAESLDEIWSPSSTMGWGGLFQDYGMGWMLAEDEGHRLFWHVGGNPGFISNLIVAPDDDIAVVTMVNSFREMDDGEPWYATDIGTRVMYRCLASITMHTIRTEST